jgi:hypothetical protein
MNQKMTLFGMFGGIRPMARALDEAPANVSAWKQKGRIPAEKQPHVLQRGLMLGLPITAEHVVFPLGRPNAAFPENLAASPPFVLCDRSAGMQRKDIL